MPTQNPGEPTARRPEARALPSQDPVLHIRLLVEAFCFAASILLLLSLFLRVEARAEIIHPVCAIDDDALAAKVLTPTMVRASNEPVRRLILIGFMGGHVSANNLVHQEARVARDLERRYPMALRAAVFANRDGDAALHAVLLFLDSDSNGCLSARERSDARIVIYGHSWGASETVALAQRLNQLVIPVLLTVQVDSVQKSKEHDDRIPPNVQEAVNFYQSDGLLHGRSTIEAADPSHTTILGNFASTYKTNPVSCAGYPWYARAFMHSHIEIENDPIVWNRIETLIQSKVIPQSADPELASDR